MTFEQSEHAAQVRLRFKEALQLLESQEMWGVSTGGSAGSALFFAIGDHVPLDRPFRNEQLPLSLRTHEGEFNLFIQCPWRLERNTHVIATSDDDHGQDGFIVKVAAQLTGQTVRSAELLDSGNDLHVCFSDGATLIVFPTATGRTNWDDYHLRTPSTTFVVRSTEVAIEREAIDRD